MPAQTGRQCKLIRSGKHYDTAHAVFHPKMMTPRQLEAGYLRSYRQFYGWSSIWRRASCKREGMLPRLMMNVAYKKPEPMWEVLIACGHTSWVFRLFMKAVHAYGTVGGRLSAPSRVATNRTSC